MKLSIIATSLILLSCASSPIPPPSQIENPEPIPVQIAAGHTATISFRCEQKEINHSLVWLDCSFENRDLSGNMGASMVCISVGYYTDSNGMLVAQKELCSNGPVPTKAETKFVAFTKDERRRLDDCGEQMEKCILLVRPRGW